MAKTVSQERIEEALVVLEGIQEQNYTDRSAKWWTRQFLQSKLPQRISGFLETEGTLAVTEERAGS